MYVCMYVCGIDNMNKGLKIFSIDMIYRMKMSEASLE